MRLWVEAAISALAAATVGTLLAFLKYIWSRQKAQSAQQEAIKEGMLALMHDRIFNIYAECQRKKYATVEEIRNVEYLYQPYHSLGGNGTGTELYERIKKMPTTNPHRIDDLCDEIYKIEKEQST